MPQLCFYNRRLRSRAPSSENPLLCTFTARFSFPKTRLIHTAVALDGAISGFGSDSHYYGVASTVRSSRVALSTTIRLDESGTSDTHYIPQLPAICPFPRELRFRRCRSGNFRFEKPFVKTCFLNPETECLPLQEPVETAFRPLQWEHLTLPAGKFQRDLFFAREFRVFSPAFSRLGLPPEFHRLADLPLVFTAIGEASGLVATSASGVLHEHDCGPLKPLLNECSTSPCDEIAPSRCSGTRHFFGLSPY